MSALIKLLDRPVAYQPAFAQLKSGKVKSGPTAAVLLSQFVYWHNRMDGEWMYKTRDDIKKETGLSRDEQETARKRLVALGILEEDLRGVPATLHYRINSDRLEVLLLSPDRVESQMGAIPPTRRRQSRQLDGGNPANKKAAIPPTSGEEPRQQAGGDPANFPTGDYTESTQETTQSNPTHNARGEEVEPVNDRQVPEYPGQPGMIFPAAQMIGKFPMHPGWKPSPEFPRQAALWGKPLQSGLNLPAELASFIAYWASEGKVFTQTQWELKFASNLQGAKPTQSRGNSHAGLDKYPATANAAQRKMLDARAAQLKERGQGLDVLGADAGNIFQPVDGQKRIGPVGPMDCTNWEFDQRPDDERL